MEPLISWTNDHCQFYLIVLLSNDRLRAAKELFLTLGVFCPKKLKTTFHINKGARNEHPYLCECLEGKVLKCFSI